MREENGMMNHISLQVDGRRKWYDESYISTDGWEEKMVDASLHQVSLQLDGRRQWYDESYI